MIFFFLPAIMGITSMAGIQWVWGERRGRGYWWVGVVVSGYAVMVTLHVGVRL